MDVPSDERLLATCLLSAAVGVVGWRVLFPERGDGVTFLLAVVTLALAMAIGGYVTATR